MPGVGVLFFYATPFVSPTAVHRWNTTYSRSCTTTHARFSYFYASIMHQQRKILFCTLMMLLLSIEHIIYLATRMMELGYRSLYLLVAHCLSFTRMEAYDIPVVAFLNSSGSNQSFTASRCPAPWSKGCGCARGEGAYIVPLLRLLAYTASIDGWLQRTPIRDARRRRGKTCRGLA